MAVPLWVQRPLLKIVDSIYARVPQATPGRNVLKACKIVSHRGAFDNHVIFENTIAAFDPVRDAGVWGIELDIRWTRDLHPVVFHDRDLTRLFGVKHQIGDLNLKDLKDTVKIIPTLREVVARYAKQLHLMMEIKKEEYPDPVYQSRLLSDLFSPLTPAIDFHFLSLHPEMFGLLNFLPPSALLPIAEINVARFSRLSLRKNYGGLLGHYFFLTNSLLKAHNTRSQGVGTGFVNSRRCLFRELNRGVTWIFSDHALKLQAACDDW